MSQHEGDPALQAVLDLDRHMREQLVIWFINAIIAIVILLFCMYKSDTVSRVDRNRNYISVDTRNVLIESQSKRQPASYDNEEIQGWLLNSLEQCMMFDYQNYASVANHCNAHIFSLNMPPNTAVRHGQAFYRQLERSGIIRTLIDNRTAMRIQIDSSTLHKEGVRDFKYITSVLGDMVTESLYTYEYDVVFRIKMDGQKLDAPIKYRVVVEKMSPLIREFPLGVRSIVSLE
ncbi:hypothetical protein [Vibrio agarivorans]|uniref:hypothetical protein n=1 Tax=Vibrio agarivorans TaxID=153622 RepID=UPI0025B28688|nr:hypothetical protein [Vibrio agarivorans]MDN3661065.1 hypothetical protein [Vibrio agarivorans]